MKFIRSSAIALAMAMPAAASAATITLDFEDVLAVYPQTAPTAIGNFYNGGTSGQGTSGPDYGVGFSDNALAFCLNTIGSSQCSNGSRGGLGDPDSQRGALAFLLGSETFMNVAAGFATGFSFFYTAINVGGSVSVYDGVNGTGNLLATLGLAPTPSTCSAAYQASFCPFVATGVGFAGIARSVSFAGVADNIGFDDVTFGSVMPDTTAPVPVPASLPLLGGGLATLTAVRRRRRKA